MPVVGGGRKGVTAEQRDSCCRCGTPGGSARTALVPASPSGGRGNSVSSGEEAPAAARSAWLPAGLPGVLVRERSRMQSVRPPTRSSTHWHRLSVCLSGNTNLQQYCHAPSVGVSGCYGGRYVAIRVRAKEQKIGVWMGSIAMSQGLTVRIQWCIHYKKSVS